LPGSCGDHVSLLHGQSGIMNMLDQAQLDGFRQQLVQQREELLALAISADESTKTVTLDQAGVGRLSRRDAPQGQAMSLEMKRRRELEIKMIAAALRRLDEGEFGYCVECEEEIANKRLELNPAIPVCISCASQSETMGS